MPDPAPRPPRGACAGLRPDIFYPERGQSTAEAKAVCAGCPVTAECLAYALAIGERDGVYGGLSASERRGMRRRQAVPA